MATQEDDPEIIKNVMLLWLTITTKTGPTEAPLWDALTAPDEQGCQARAELAEELAISSDLVDYFVLQAADSTNADVIQATQSLFHTLVQEGLEAEPYEGPFCPLHKSAITSLLPAGSQVAQSRPAAAAVAAAKLEVVKATAKLKSAELNAAAIFAAK